MIVLSLITFLSAFLLFQIELIIAKLFLPNYGGSYLVWGACVVFFQAVLLLGYLFAHTVIKRQGFDRYLPVHLALMLMPFLFFPGRPIMLSGAGHSLPLVMDVFLRLLLTIGPVFFVLSTVSLVTQTWLSNAVMRRQHSPYALYAVSNLGSFAALLSYPFIVELYFTNTQQLNMWRLLYVVLTALTLLAWRMIKRQQPVVENAQAKPLAALDRAQVLRWLLLSAAGVVLFLSVTNIITYEVAPVPLLWILPLAIYLLAFVFNFKKNPWCPRWISRHSSVLIGLNLGLFLTVWHNVFPTIIMIVLLSFLLFCLCMYAQHQLINTKPVDDRQLTLFYVMISLGGFLGGVLTSWIIPVVSNTLVEFLVGLLLLAITLDVRQQKLPKWKIILALGLMVGVCIFWPHVYKAYSLIGILILFVAVSFAFTYLGRAKIVLIGFLGLLIISVPWLEENWRGIHSLVKKRNYYGIYEIHDTSAGIRILVHGTTLHGLEFTDERRRYIPLGYYSPLSPIGSLLIKNIFEAKRIGVVGLGSGTLALYAKPSCPIDFYELDPDVYRFANEYFWYINSAPGPLNFIIGDARVSLDKNAGAIYDVLVVDAFGGDAIPTHLVNRDMVLKYKDHLSPRGALMFHITNRYLDLAPVLTRIASSVGAHIAFKDVPDGGPNMRSFWCVLTWDDERFLTLITKEGWQLPDADQDKSVGVWSDDYSSILPILKVEDLKASIEHFNPFKW